MLKIKISLTVKEETLDQLEKLGRVLFPFNTVSRGDVVDFLVGEKVQSLANGKILASQTGNAEEEAR